MFSSQLSKILRDCYHNAKEKQVALSIHLFGIKFAKELGGHRIEDICVMADVPKSYATEIRKGIRLAEFVSLKSDP